MAENTLDHGSNISGISLLLNVEKISNEIDVDDMERKVKNMFIEDIIEDNEEQEDEQEVIKEYEDAIEEIETVIGDDGDDEDDEDEDDDDEDEDDEDEDEDEDKSNFKRISQRPYLLFLK